MKIPLAARNAAGPALEVGHIGVGTWAIGGPFATNTGAPVGYGRADDRTSIDALHCALDLGARLVDTSDVYGTGHAERIVGRAIKGRRSDVFLATKFGHTHDEGRRVLTGADASPQYIRAACVASLRRLETDWIDLYQLHLGDLPLAQADEVADTLDELCEAGHIRYYGWSTDDPARATAFVGRPRVVAMQFDMNVLHPAAEMVATCASNSWIGLARLPLAMGALSGKYSQASQLPTDDIRSTPPDWLTYFGPGGNLEACVAERIAAIRELLTSDGCTLAQGALKWIVSTAEGIIPIPGIRSVEQARENLGALNGALFTKQQLLEIDRWLER